MQPFSCILIHLELGSTSQCQLIKGPGVSSVQWSDGVCLLFSWRHPCFTRNCVLSLGEDLVMSQRFMVFCCMAGETSVWFGHESEVYGFLADFETNQWFIVFWCLVGDTSVWFGHESEVCGFLSGENSVWFGSGSEVYGFLAGDNSVIWQWIRGLWCSGAWQVRILESEVYGFLAPGRWEFLNQRFMVLWCMADENSLWFGHKWEVCGFLAGENEFCVIWPWIIGL